MRGLVLGIYVVLCTATATAVAEPVAGDELFRPPIEWSTWMRLGYGFAREPASIVARGDGVEPIHHYNFYDVGLGVEASLPLSVHGHLRAGAWIERRIDETFAGGELVFTAAPQHLNMFLYEVGHGILAVRAGRSATQGTAAIAWGFLAPWKLEGPCEKRFFDIYTGVCEPRPKRATRYMVGVRLVTTLNRAIADPRDWSATFGIEFEPLGALRATLAIRSWY